MDPRRALLGDPDVRHRLAGTLIIMFVFLFLLYAAYWRSNAAYGASTEVTTQFSAIRAVTPELSDSGHSNAAAILYLPAAALAVLVQYHGGAALYTLAAGPVLPVASALARVAFSPLPDVLEIDVLAVTLPTHIRLGLAVGALAVVVGSVFRYWRPPNERSLSEHFFGPSVNHSRALAVIITAGVVAAVFTVWLYSPYIPYYPFTFAVFGAPIAAFVYWRWRTIVLAWLGNAAVVLGHAAANWFLTATPDYVVDPGFFVPAVMTAAALGVLGVGAVIVFREVYAIVSHRVNIAS